MPGKSRIKIGLLYTTKPKPPHTFKFAGQVIAKVTSRLLDYLLELIIAKMKRYKMLMMMAIYVEDWDLVKTLLARREEKARVRALLEEAIHGYFKEVWELNRDTNLYTLSEVRSLLRTPFKKLFTLLEQTNTPLYIFRGDKIYVEVRSGEIDLEENKKRLFIHSRDLRNLIFQRAVGKI